MALGIGIQNFPEGAAISPPAAAGRGFRPEKLCLWKSFGSRGTDFRRAGGLGSGRDTAADAMAVELAAGAMIYVVVVNSSGGGIWTSIIL